VLTARRPSRSHEIVNHANLRNFKLMKNQASVHASILRADHALHLRKLPRLLDFTHDAFNSFFCPLVVLIRIGTRPSPGCAFAAVFSLLSFSGSGRRIYPPTPLATSNRSTSISPAAMYSQRLLGSRSTAVVCILGHFLPSSSTQSALLRPISTTLINWTLIYSAALPCSRLTSLGSDHRSAGR
jgi:hypothetical protein